jgi:hypothetical protein
MASGCQAGKRFFDRRRTFLPIGVAGSEVGWPAMAHAELPRSARDGAPVAIWHPVPLAA